MNSKTSTFIVSLIIGIVVGGGVYGLIHSITHSGTVITEQGTTNTYSNGTYGITFTYPNSYILTEKDSTTGDKLHTITLIAKADATPMNASSTPGEGPTAITFDFYKNADNKTLANWVKETNDSNFNLGDGVATPVNIAGVPALTYSWSGLYGGNTIVFAHTNIVMASMTYLTYQDPIWKDFGSIIQSLKFQ